MGLEGGAGVEAASAAGLHSSEIVKVARAKQEKWETQLWGRSMADENDTPFRGIIFPFCNATGLGRNGDDSNR
jgi:hypothetical protein